MNKVKLKHNAFILKIDEGFYYRLQDLALSDGITMSGVVRQLVNREYQTRYGNNENKLKGSREGIK
jgi:hypothetical protein